MFTFESQWLIWLTIDEDLLALLLETENGNEGWRSMKFLACEVVVGDNLLKYEPFKHPLPFWFNKLFELNWGYSPSFKPKPKPFSLISFWFTPLFDPWPTIDVTAAAITEWRLGSVLIALLIVSAKACLEGVW